MSDALTDYFNGDSVGDPEGFAISLLESEYLNFELDDHYEGKTERVVVVAKKRLEILGEIKWFGRWRQYAFFPEGSTVWNKTCLDDVQNCIELLKKRRDELLSHA